MTKQRLIAFFLGLIFVFTLGELLLNLEAWITSSSPVTIDDSKPTIMILGNSYSSEELAIGFPSYAKLLREQLGQKYNIVNLAEPMMNTRRILNAVLAWNNKPAKLVFMMAGQANSPHDSEFRNYQQEVASIKKPGAFDLIQHTLEKSKFFRLLSYLYYKLDSKKEEPVLNSENEKKSAVYHHIACGFASHRQFNCNGLIKDITPVEFLDLLNQLIQQFPENSQLKMAKFYYLSLHDNGSPESIEKAFSSLFEDGGPIDIDLFEYIGSLKKGTYSSRIPKTTGLTEKKQRILMSAETLDPLPLSKLRNMKPLLIEIYGNKHYSSRFPAFYLSGSQALRRLSENDLACEVAFAGYERFLGYSGRTMGPNLRKLMNDCSPGKKSELEKKLKALQQLSVSVGNPVGNIGTVKQWRESDIKKIVRFLRESGTEVVLQTYHPYRHSNDPRPENASILKVGKEEDLKVINHFDEILSRYPDPAARDFLYLQGVFKGTFDDHYSAEGHQLIAERLLRFLNENGY